MESNKYDRKVDIFALGLIYFELVWPMKTRMEKHNVSKLRYMLINFQSKCTHQRKCLIKTYKLQFRNLSYLL